MHLWSFVCKLIISPQLGLLTCRGGSHLHHDVGRGEVVALVEVWFATHDLHLGLGESPEVLPRAESGVWYDDAQHDGLDGAVGGRRYRGRRRRRAGGGNVGRRGVDSSTARRLAYPKTHAALAGSARLVSIYRLVSDSCGVTILDHDRQE